ncbi:MAG: TonB-dependent receptor plug domain-containing protein [Sulfurospirillaceae bacterium]|nr:TonB-dependent receptor plug domain-containing protein [Sulfurospirillaceae bacterium]
MNMKKVLFILLIFTCIIYAQEDITNLLSNFAQKSDLSEQTKKESAGFLKIYTRQDLDRMQIHTLREILDKLPFLRYNEDNQGRTSPFYIPYQPEPQDIIRVYINDRELVTPFRGNALGLFGQISMNYIDHIEIYMGIPSATLGIQTARITIKCYTKDPKREETNLVGMTVGSYNTKNIYGYSAQSLDKFSYLAYINNRQLGKKHINYKGTKLSRDKDITNFYGEIRKDNLRFETQIVKGSLDNFIGNSLNMDPKSNYTDFSYFYTGLYYKNTDNGLKAFVNFAQDRNNHYEKSKTILGIMSLTTPPYIYAYQDYRANMTARISDAQIYKTIKTNKNKLLIGIQSRYKNFNFENLRFGNIHINNSANYNSEFILSTFAENSYLIDESNMVTSTIKYSHIAENGDVQDYKTYLGRLGYIYNNEKWTSKTFFFVGEVTPTMQILFDNRVFYHQTTDLKKARKIAFGTELIYKTQKYTTSIFVDHSIGKNSVYFDGSAYRNFTSTNTIDTIDFTYKYMFNSLNSIELDAWTNRIYKENHPLGSVSNYYGGMISILNSIGKFDFSNDLVYKHWPEIQNDGWNLNSSITYHYSRPLTLYVKAENILGKALKSDYYIYNSITNTTNYLNNVDSIDRRVWLKVEYQF